MKTDCRDCLFSQRCASPQGSKLICRHRDIGHVIAKKKSQWFLDNDDIAAPCTGFMTKREVPDDSPLRQLIGPGQNRLRAIAEESKRAKKLHDKAVKAKINDLFM